MLNTTDTYTQAGEIAGRASRQHDAALANAQHSWLTRALGLENKQDREVARALFNAAYREASNFHAAPVYFR